MLQTEMALSTSTEVDEYIVLSTSLKEVISLMDPL